MKKLISILVLAIAMAGSLFAFNIGFGLKGMAGVNAGTSIQDTGANVAAIGDTKAETDFVWAGGAYLDLTLIGPVGIQAGANMGKNKVSGSGFEYSELILDVPVMLWSEFKFGFLGLGFGAGPNISFTLDSDGSVMGSTYTKEDFDINKAVWGVAAGANLKIYFNKHVALVAGANYVLDIQKKELEVKAVDTSVPVLSFNRSVVYGDLGLEFKVF